jgi:predicted secreted Zn-dependent protease
VVSAVQREDDQPDTGTVTIGNVQYDYYDVTGNTLAEVAQQLDPTEWGRCSYHYDYSYESTGGRATKVDTTLNLTIRLPRWQGRGWNRASQAAKAEWQRMLHALGTHEDDHADIARRWAPTFQQRLLNQRVGNLRQRFNRTLGQVRAEQRRFDRRTRHGQTQGVSLDTSIQ